MALGAIRGKPSRQEHSLIVNDLNIIAIGSGGEARFIARHGFFHLFASLGVVFLAWHKSRALHPVIEGPWPSPERLAENLEAMHLEHAEKTGKAEGTGVGRVAKPLDLIIKLKLRVAFRSQRVEDQQPAFGLRHADHLLENRLRLGYMVKGMLATDQIEAGVGKGKRVRIPAENDGIGNLLLSLELAGLTNHLRRQVNA
ncbi:hypothetical protein SBA2_250045 [Acidobacteriia bacterium SbA2]|nr:hypothetical protein SBA2_250045 [Acidobacteriia bacterium SbA2]